MHRDPGKKAKLWAERLADVETKRARYQEMVAEGLITFDELRRRLVELEEMRKTAERELAAVRGHEEHVRSPERHRDGLLDYLVDVDPRRSTRLRPSNATSSTRY